MALVLVSIDEVVDLIEQLPVVTVGEKNYVMASDLAGMVAQLTTDMYARATAIERHDRADLDTDAGRAAFQETLHGELEHRADEAFDARCRNCVGEPTCDRYPHPDGLCVECDCRNYEPIKAPTAEDAPPADFVPYVSSPEIESAGIFAKPPISDRPIIQ